ncbi:IS110 family transposase [Dankookia rubra]|uniref:IS110 family transposase n=1 Tax=Dankookia rubra TaxID=1442381 RepID=A0A4R5Q2D9_9PROT|nr:IS110 family transposase [Dankookia rubra]
MTATPQKPEGVGNYSVCVIDGNGAVMFEGKVAAEPGALVSLIRKRAPQAARVGLETGATSPWLYHSLKKADLPVVLMDARHAHAALSMRPTKSDRSDARGLAEMLRMRWYRAVTAKSFTAHERMALLGARRHLVEIRVELDGQIRGLLKTFGLILGKGNTDALIRRAETLAEGNPVISSLVAKLAEVQRQVVAQIAALDRDIRHLVRSEPALKRFMTVPGVGPITALAFLSTIDDPERFKHARDVGPYLGLTPTRYQSGETDRHGRISKCGDAFTRTCLYEAANVLLTKVQQFSPLKAWGTRLVQRIGAKKARVVVARKIAVILRCIWVDGTEFWWTRQEAKMA